MQMNKLFSYGITVALFFTQIPANASIVNLSTIKGLLQNTKAGWQPKDSWVNNLSKEELDRVLGYKQKISTERDFYLYANHGANSTDTIDWRNKDGQNWVSPILNQGSCGSCVAFASIATLETQMNISRKASWLNPHYSAEALFSCGGGGCDYGWQPESAASYLQSNGVPDEACAPYTMGATGQDSSCSSICSDANSRSQQITNYDTFRDPDSVKAALKHGPLVTTLNVYADFLVYGSGVYKHVSGSYLGGHAVSIVGFNDAGRYWIVRNSWGADWGDNGFVRISYDDISGIGQETWGFNIPDASGAATIHNLHDHDYLAGKVNFEANSTFPNTTQIDLQITSQNAVASPLSCKATNCSLAVDSTKLTDGRYEANLLVTANGHKIPTEKKFFYVANKRPSKLELRMQPKSGLDLQRPISDRVEFDIEATSSSVPFSTLTFTVKQGNKIVETRSTDVTLPKMIMGWRTPVVPNGTYDIYLQGNIKTSTANYQAESNHFTVTVQN